MPSANGLIVLMLVNLCTLFTTTLPKPLTLSHPKLLSILSSIGVSGKVLSWIKCFLYDHVQCVCVNNQFSFCLLVLSGVPKAAYLVLCLLLILMKVLKYQTYMAAVMVCIFMLMMPNSLAIMLTTYKWH